MTFQRINNGSFPIIVACLSVCLFASVTFVDLASAQTDEDQESTTSEPLITVKPTIIIQEEEEERQVVIDPAVTVVLPTFAVPTLTSTVSVPDGGTLVLGGGIRVDTKRRSSRELINRAPRSAQLENQVCSHEIDDQGDSTYDILHNMNPLKIIVRQNGKIEMKLIRHYDLHNLEALQTDHPEIAMHISAIPETSPGNGKVQLSLDIETFIDAENATELAADSPEYFAIYMRYVLADVQSK